MKYTLLTVIFALALAAFGCADGNKDLRATKSDQSAVKQDGSTVVVSTEPGGIKSEVRTFPSGEVARVTRITRPDGSQKAVVEFRDGRTTELSEKSDIDSLMDASAESIKGAATVTWEATKAASEKAIDKGKEIGKDVGEKVGQGVEAAGKGIKKAGDAVKNAGQKVKDKINP